MFYYLMESRCKNSGTFERKKFYPKKSLTSVLHQAIQLITRFIQSVINNMNFSLPLRQVTLKFCTPRASVCLFLFLFLRLPLGNDISAPLSIMQVDIKSYLTYRKIHLSLKYCLKSATPKKLTFC